MDLLLQLAAAAAGTLGFALLLNVRGRHLLFGTIGGFLSWAVYLIMYAIGLSDILSCVIASMAVAVYAEVFSRRLKTPATVYIITGLIPLIPGGSLYHTMEYAVLGEADLFAHQALHTLLLAAAIATGLLVISTLIKLLKRS